MLDPAARQRARDGAADAIATRWEVIVGKNSGFAPVGRRCGTYSSYTSKGCRCQLCKDAKNQYERNLRVRKRAEREQARAEIH